MGNRRIKPAMVVANLDLIAAGISLVVLVFLTFSGVIMRYIVGRPYTWLEETQMACMVWIVFASAGAAFTTGSHVAIEMVVDLLPPAIQKLMDLLIAIVVTLIIAYLALRSLDYLKMLAMSEKRTSMLRIPYVYIYFIVPLSCALMLIKYYYVFYIKHVKKQGDAV